MLEPNNPRTTPLKTRFTMHFDPTQAIWAMHQFGEFGGVNPSITDSATYTFLGAKTMEDTFHGETAGCFLYSRHWSPSNRFLSEALAAMEGTPAGWVTASGMAAITNVVMQICNAGDHIVASRTVYGGTFAFFNNYLPKFHIEVSFVDPTDLAAIQAAIRPNTKLVYTETLTNPLLAVSDIAGISRLTRPRGIKLVVDNTFTPLIFAPYRMGADVVVYSMTKFINGKNDLIAGAILADEAFIASLIDVNTGTSMLLGPVLDPLRSSGILKNLHTLHIRMQKHSSNAAYMAERFKQLGIRVVYPGLPEHPQHQLMKESMHPDFGFGGMIAIDLGTHERANRFMEHMQDLGVGYLAVSLGYFRTLFSASGSSTSSEVPLDEQQRMGLSPGLVRFSMGLDHNIQATWQLVQQAFDLLG